MIVLLCFFLLLRAICLLESTCHVAKYTQTSFITRNANTAVYSVTERFRHLSGAGKDRKGNPKVFSSHIPIPTREVAQWKHKLLDTWKNHGESIVLGTVYGIRIFRFILHVRNLLEWLPQANPYLFPFDAIYQATNAYLKLFQSLIPPLYGFDISAIVAIFILDHIESLLAHKPGVAQEALR